VNKLKLELKSVPFKFIEGTVNPEYNVDADRLNLAT
jgi:hypothetical protein